MPSALDIAFHHSQFLGEVRRELLANIRRRQLNPKFHYDTVKQAVKWLAVHKAFSPWQTDAECREIYERAFIESIRQWPGTAAHVIGLGCGEGTKEERLLRLLKEQGRDVFYSPVDVSSPLIITATLNARKTIESARCRPLVCDLARGEDVGEILNDHAAPGIPRLLTFFGMIPNFVPATILPRLRSLMRPGDLLLFSANLAPGPDYAAGMERILPHYDNAPTCDWLMTLLLDLGVGGSDGGLQIAIEDCPEATGLKRIGAWFTFHRPRSIDLGEEQFDFVKGDRIQLFFSYRYTPLLLSRTLACHGITVNQQWTTASEEEGVFLCNVRSRI